jgi:hypothetical protein
MISAGGMVRKFTHGGFECAHSSVEVAIKFLESYWY